MKRIVLKFVMFLGVITCAILLIGGVVSIADGGFVSGLPYIIAAVAGLAAVGVLYIFLASLCEIVENLEEMNASKIKEEVIYDEIKDIPTKKVVSAKKSDNEFDD